MRDLEELAKETVRNWNTSYKAKDDPVKQEKRRRQCVQNRRSQRQHAVSVQRRDHTTMNSPTQQTKEHRSHPEVIAIYAKKHPGIDVLPFLKTPFMTEENSECSDEDPEKRSQHRQDVEKKAGLTEEDITKGIKALEKVSLAFRSRKVIDILLTTSSALNTLVQMGNIMKDLDEISVNRVKKTYKSVVPSFRRADLGRKRDDAPDRPVYPFMVSKSWLVKHKKDENLHLRSKDPSGIRKDYDDEDYTTETSTDSGDSEEEENGQPETVPEVSTLR